MQVTVKKLPKSQIEVAVELSPDELTPYLTKAAASLSREHPIKGFRPGKVPLDVVMAAYGAMAVWEEALDPAVRDSFVRAVEQEALPTVGAPKVEVIQLAPENPVKYTATVAVLPEVQLPTLSRITCTRRPVQVTTADVDKALRDLQHMQPIEALVDRAATDQDKVVVDMELSRGGVPIEGGRAAGHQVELAEEYSIPKVREELIGMRKDDAKTFPIEFPKDHFQKTLAGQTVDCQVKVTSVFTVAYPELDDAFAKRLGIDSLLALRGRIRENLETEAKQQAHRQEDVELLDALVTEITVAELPEILITNEAHRMVEELERNVTQRGLPFDQYLEQLKKTRDDLLLEMAPEAVRRVKVSLATRAVVEQQPDACVVTDADVEAHITEQLNRYRDDEGFADRIQSDESRSYIRNMLKSEKVIAWLRAQVQWKDAK